MLPKNPNIITQCQDDLREKGYCLQSFKPADDLKSLVQQNNFSRLDEKLNQMTAPEGELFQKLRDFENFSSIEFILSLREATNAWEEDGIWHDDGSRLLAFSLSLTLNPVEGGCLGFREKNSSQPSLIPTPKFGDILIFKTGTHGYEHKIHAVTRGSRLVCAGWCS